MPMFYLIIIKKTFAQSKPIHFSMLRALKLEEKKTMGQKEIKRHLE